MTKKVNPRQNPINQDEVDDVIKNGLPPKIKKDLDPLLNKNDPEDEIENNSIDYDDEPIDEDEIDEEVVEIMENQDIDLEQAERVRDLMDEYGLDEDDAMELDELMG